MLTALAIAALAASCAHAQDPAVFAISGDWEVRVAGAAIRVAPPRLLTVTAETYEPVPVFNPKANGWVKGAQLRGVKAQETTSPNMLDGSSLVLRAGPEADAELFAKGSDYDFDPLWGTFGRIEGGAIKANQPVYAWYRHAQARLDSVVRTAQGKTVVREGAPSAAAPWPPRIGGGERHLGNIYLPGMIAKLEPEHLFPVLELAYPEPPKQKPSIAERLCPKAMERLKSGQPIRILAWGDSVTDGAYLPKPDGWQAQFVTRLRERFPNGEVELLTQAWGGATPRRISPSRRGVRTTTRRPCSA